LFVFLHMVVVLVSSSLFTPNVFDLLSCFSCLQIAQDISKLAESDHAGDIYVPVYVMLPVSFVIPFFNIYFVIFFIP